MRLRSKWRKRPGASVAVAVTCLVIAAGLLLWFFTDDPDAKYRVTQRWYYDRHTGELFPGDRSLEPPTDAPSGQKINNEPAGVRAFVFGCGNCDDTFIGFLQTYSADARAAIASEKISNRERWRRVALGEQIRRVTEDDTAWVQKVTPQGSTIMMELATRCQGKGSLKPCYP